jgi:CspA family cold shock protein
MRRVAFFLRWSPNRERWVPAYGPRNGSSVQRAKGYGFISPVHGGGDVFVRYSDIEGAGFRSLQEGEKVTYEVAQHRKGVQAQNVAKA